MDMRHKSQYEFLDLSDLDDRTRDEIITALNCSDDTEILQLPWDTGEIDYDTVPAVVNLEEKRQWQNYENESQPPKYESDRDMATSTVMTMAPDAVYQQQMMTPMYNNSVYIRQPNVYINNIATDVGLQAYIPSVPFSQSVYLSGTESHEMPLPREGRRRGNRGRGNKRDTNNRNVDSSNDMSATYLGHGQYHHIQRNMYPQPTFYYSPDHSGNPQQHSAGISPLYYPATTYSPSHSYPVYSQSIQQAAMNSQYMRHPLVQTPCPMPEAVKTSVPDPMIETPPQNVYKSAKSNIQRQSATLNSSQTNIVTTVIVNNNKIEHDVNNDINECNGSADHVSKNQKVPPMNVTIEHNIVAMVKKDCKLKKTEVPYQQVNINSSIEVNQKTEHDVQQTSEDTVAPLSQNAPTTVSMVPNVPKPVPADTFTMKPVPIDAVLTKPLPKDITLMKPIVKDSATLKPVTKDNVPSKAAATDNAPGKQTPIDTAMTKPIPKEVPFVKTTSRETMLTKSSPKDVPIQKQISTDNIIGVVPDEIVPENCVNIVPTEESVITPPVSTAPVVPEIGKSWASILKKGNTDSFASIGSPKPMARINPLHINTAPSQDNSSKFESTTHNATTPQQSSWKYRDSVTPESKNGEAPDLNQIQAEERTSTYNFDDPDAYKMGEFLSTYQMEKQTVSLLPRGLINRNNYCYINSILQALLACPPFYNLLSAIPCCRNTPKNTSHTLINNMIKFVHEFSLLSAGARLPRKDRAQKRTDEQVLHVQSGIAFEPTYVYTMLKNTSCSGIFSVEGRQEDAEEFLSCLLNGISDEMLEMMKLVNKENTPNNVPMNVNNGDQEEWKIMGPKNKGSITRCTEFGRTPLSDIFRGQLRYRVCRAGDQTTDTVQPFFTLQLDVEKAESVKGALEILVGKDVLEGITCSKTKQEIEAWKQVTLEELPVILILHLKWFDYKLDGCSKILKSVEFPIDLKIDSKILSPNAVKKLMPKQKQYKLFAVTYHDGKEATKGHYVTDAFHVGYGGWVRYDDSSVKGVSEQNVLNPLPPRVPYLLYYRRCDTIGNNSTSSNDRSR